MGKIFKICIKCTGFHFACILKFRALRCSRLVHIRKSQYNVMLNWPKNSIIQKNTFWILFLGKFECLFLVSFLAALFTYKRRPGKKEKKKCPRVILTPTADKKKSRQVGWGEGIPTSSSMPPATTKKCISLSVFISFFADIQRSFFLFQRVCMGTQKMLFDLVIYS